MGVTRHPLLSDVAASRLGAIPLDMDLINRLESSFAAISGDFGGSFVGRFYESLFASHPELRRMFPADLAPQKQKLLDMLRATIDAFRNPAAARAQLEQLGARHLKYGAQAAHYPIVVRLMTEAMAQAAGENWTKETRRDWQTALELVSELMQVGAQDTAAPN